MAQITHEVASRIVKLAFADATRTPEHQIRGHMTIRGDLRLDQIAMSIVSHSIILAVERAGFHALFSRDDLLLAHTVADVTHIVVAGTDSGGPKARP